MDETNADKPPSHPYPVVERLDEDGLPLDREPTIDDVRGGANHFKLAVGCSAVVFVAIVAFWVLRVLLAR